MNPSVSVAIITYNKADTVGAAIESVLRQTYTDYEILVVDDGSTDNTAGVVAGYGDRVRYLPKKNGGTGSARNLGIAEARGRMVAFLDGDDLWLPRKLELQMAAFDREPGILAVQCGAYCVDPSLRVFEKRVCRPRLDRLEHFLLFRNLPAFSSTVVVRKEAFERIGGFGTDLVILSDWDMACRLAAAGTLRSIPDLLVLYRHYPKNQSRDVQIHVDSGIRSLKRLFSADGPLPSGIRTSEPRIWAHFYAMLSGGCARNGDWPGALRWGLRAVRSSPRVIPYIAGMPLRRLRRALTIRGTQCPVPAKGADTARQHSRAPDLRGTQSATSMGNPR